MTTITTIDDLDEARAGYLWDMLPYKITRQMIADIAQAIRAADEAAGLPTEALLAVLRGEAMIVPVVPTARMKDGLLKGLYFDDWDCTRFAPEVGFSAMLAASPWAKKEGV